MSLEWPASDTGTWECAFVVAWSPEGGRSPCGLCHTAEPKGKNNFPQSSSNTERVFVLLGTFCLHLFQFYNYIPKLQISEFPKATKDDQVPCLRCFLALMDLPPKQNRPCHRAVWLRPILRGRHRALTPGRVLVLVHEGVALWLRLGSAVLERKVLKDQIDFYVI